MAGLLCNDAHLSTNDDGHAELVGDPTEGALVVLAAKAGLDVEALRTEHPRTNEVPFDSAVKYMATLHPPIGGDGTAHDRSVLLVKGAPDVVLGRCATVRDSGSVPAQLDESRRNELETINESLGGEGLRVLALASRDLPVRAQEFEGDLDEEVCDLTLEALVGILDPPRPEAIAAVAECREAGIGVKMITGDHASTAGAIAAELGIEGKVVSGAELEEMTDEELAERIDAIGVCARVSPEHKFRVVKALQATGHVVAMTGDGVNDAPALKQADIGVAMGITGTEVTKDAGDMVLTDDNFATIVHAVERGRAIYDNIVTFVRFQLTTNVAAILSILVARLIGWPAPFNPIQVLFVNIIADGPPAMSLGMDPPKPGLMEREPRERGARILSGLAPGSDRDVRGDHGGRHPVAARRLQGLGRGGGTHDGLHDLRVLPDGQRPVCAERDVGVQSVQPDERLAVDRAGSRRGGSGTGGAVAVPPERVRHRFAHPLRVGLVSGHAPRPPDLRRDPQGDPPRPVVRHAGRVTARSSLGSGSIVGRPGVGDTFFSSRRRLMCVLR